MAFLNATPTQNSCMMRVEDLKITFTYTEIYITCNGSTSPNLIKEGSGYSTSESWTMLGLSEGMTYLVTYTLVTAEGIVVNGEANFTTSPSSFVVDDMENGYLIGRPDLNVISPLAVAVGSVGGLIISDNPSVGYMRITWFPATNANAYNIEIIDNAGIWLPSTITLNSPSVVTYDYVLARENNSYTISVWGINTIYGGEGAKSTRTYTTSWQSYVSTVSTLLVQDGILAGTITVSWSVTTGVETYVISVYKVSTGALVAQKENPRTGILALSFDVETSTQYRVTIYGKRSGVANGATTTATITTKAGTVTIGPITTLTVTDGTSTGSINVSWSSAYNATGYRVEIWRNGSYTGTGKDVTTLSTTFTGLTAGATYEIRVTPTRYSSLGSVKSVTFTLKGGTVGGVGTVRVTNGTSKGVINVSWSVATNATGYRVEVWRNGSFTGIEENITGGSVTTKQLTGLLEGTTYRIKVYGRNGTINGAASEVDFLTLGVGGVGTVSVTDGTSTGSINVSWSSASNATGYKVEVRLNGALTSLGTTISSGSTTSTTLSGLTAGTTYQIRVYGTRANYSDGAASNATFTPKSIVVGGVGTVTVTIPNNQAGTLNVAWSAATNATGYRVELHDANRVYLDRYASGTSTSATFTGLADNTVYTFKAYGTRSGSTNGTASWGEGRTLALTLGAVTGLSVSATNTKGGITFSWNAAANAEGYRWEIYLGNTTASSALVANNSTTSRSVTYNSLSEYTLYTVKVYAYRSGYTNGTAATATVRTKDLTAPVINSISGDAKMYLSWVASDAHSGLRSTDRFYTQISGAGGTSSSTHGQGQYSTVAYRTFTVDGNGNKFVHDSYYNMKLWVYDAEGNTIEGNVRVQYKQARPQDWAWYTIKSKGAPFNLTAAEWYDFCIRINAFRGYKSLTPYTFTDVSKGDIVRASYINQARTAISSMSTVPSSVSAGQEITASLFNTLRDNLNSVT